MTTRSVGAHGAQRAQGFRRDPTVPVGCRWTFRAQVADRPAVDGPRVVKLRPERDLRGVPVATGLATLVRRFRLGPPRPGHCPWTRRGSSAATRETLSTSSTPGLAAGACGWSRPPPSRLVVEVWDTTYVETGTTLACGGDATRVGMLAPIPQCHVLRVGDLLVLTTRPGAGRPVASWAARMRPDRLHAPGRLRGGQGRPAGHPRRREDDRRDRERAPPTRLRVRILTASPRGSRLRAEKGINLPDTDLPVAAVTDADLPLLEVAAAHADMVAAVVPAPRARRRRAARTTFGESGLSTSASS